MSKDGVNQRYSSSIIRLPTKRNGYRMERTGWENWPYVAGKEEGGGKGRGRGAGLFL